VIIPLMIASGCRLHNITKVRFGWVLSWVRPLEPRGALVRTLVNAFEPARDMLEFSTGPAAFSLYLNRTLFIDRYGKKPCASKRLEWPKSPNNRGRFLRPHFSNDCWRSRFIETHRGDLLNNRTSSKRFQDYGISIDARGSMCTNRKSWNRIKTTEHFTGAAACATVRVAAQEEHAKFF